MTVLPPQFHLLELNIISAQDLQPVCRRNMRTYAVAWVHSKRKLSTRIDTQGHTDPTWNDKFVFRVDDEFLDSETSTLMIEIYAVHWFRDIHVGSVRVIVKNLIPPVSPSRGGRQELPLGMSFVAFQVWRPSGRPQGILNIGVALLDNSMRSMPLYFQIGSSAVGYRHLMGEEDAFQSSNNLKILSSTKSNANNNHLLLRDSIKPEFRRTKSDSSSILGPRPRQSMKESSIVNGGPIVNDFDLWKNNYKVNLRGNSLVNYVFDKSNGIEMKSSSILNGSKKRPKIWTDSEIGPSPSEVAAAVARNMNHNKMGELESSVGEGWSLDGSMEGLDSRLERWRTELPPVYDRSNEMSSLLSDEVPTPTSKRSRHSRKRAHKNKKGLFSCFGTICGCEISVTCGRGQIC
ncbi:Auxin-responsive protein IAA13, putative isoform 1 [Hibiscus syriacus]|uniref:Auxin-responsive protein IAA13, putative isoform 1 n=1 Tax=Hibiscus syriacus TaxID=106335 RepID=A0A6A2Y2A0_HIBSY|nr:uncharacterized protein LOC120163997 [Hibiscus syriacus]KAE8677630.1 Auxin-responsive protein IAA13, putative isoform 1 [Hibiscus syriacus]